MMMLDATDLMAYWPRMVAQARKFLVEADHTDWEDAAAAAMEDALRNPQSIATTGSVEGWLMQTTRWRALNLREKFYREAGRREILTDRRAARLDAGSSSHVTTLMVRDALSALPEKLRIHADARMEGRSLREVGEYLGHTKETAYHHETALRAALRDHLAGRPVSQAVTLRPKPHPSTRPCSEDACPRAVVARGRCRMHYLRRWRSGQTGSTP